ncbi:MAG: VRR-NUC domain-containing protein, partial [Clostridia bacterium]|nr:VRR-NUC domain-containing protein [Clostridia bacterium]
MKEAQEQTALFRWTLAVRTIYPLLRLLFHIPNGGRRDTIEARRLKEQGVKKGVPDLFLPVARAPYHGLFIEMKTDTGQPTQAQKWWLEELRTQGYLALVAHGQDEARGILQDYLKGDKLMIKKAVTNRERMRRMGNKELAREILALLDGDFMTRCCRNLPECQAMADRDEAIPDEKCIG